MLACPTVTPPTAAPTRFPIGLAIGLYAGMLGLACLWSWLRADPGLLVWHQSPRPSPWLAAGIGVAIGLVVVGASRVAASRLAWAADLEREFARLLGPLSASEVCVLTAASAVAEEAFFRAAMQPSLGLVLTAVVFGLMHFGPRRTLWPWTLMALGMGFVLGWLADWSGSLVAPILCHATINGLNLWAIALKARPPDPAGPAAR